VLGLRVRYIADADHGNHENKLVLPSKNHNCLGQQVTVTLPPRDYDSVRRMAKEKKVSASWIVRDAVEKYTQSAPKKV